MSILPRSFKFWLGLLVSGLCLWLAMRRVPLADLGAHLRAMRVSWIGAAVLLQLVAVFWRAQRWLVLLPRRVRFLDSFLIQGIGYLFTNLFPLRLGEPVRLLVMARRCRAPLLEVAPSVAIERLLDVASILLTLLVILPFLQIRPLLARTALLFAVLCAVVLAALILSVRFQSATERLMRIVLDRLRPRWSDLMVRRWRELVVGMRPLFTPRGGGAAVALSLLTWVFSIATYWCVMLAFNSRATPLEAAFLIVALSFAVSIPSSPGFIGVFHLVAQQTLALQFGAKYDGATALSIALTAHLVYYFTTTALGIVGLWRVGGSLFGLLAQARIGPTDRAGNT